MYRALPYCVVDGYAPICCDTNDPYTIQTGFEKRLLRDIPQADPVILLKFKLFVEHWLFNNLTPFSPVDFSIIFEEWFSQLKFNQARLKQYRDAYDKLYSSSPNCRMCEFIKSFPKTEYYDEFKFPRIINSRCDMFKVFCGPYFHKIEAALFSLRWFVKGLSITDKVSRVSMLLRSNYRYFVSDFKAFESHFTPNFMEICECRLYTYMFPGDSNIIKICEVIMGKNRLHMTNKCSLTVVGRRMSGEMCTS